MRFIEPDAPIPMASYSPLFRISYSYIRESQPPLFNHGNSLRCQISSLASHLFASSRDSTGLSNGACNAMEDDQSSNLSSKQSPLTIWPAPAIVAYVRPPPLRTKPETSPLATDHTLSGLLRNSSCRLHSRASVMRSFPIYEPSLSALSLLLKSLPGKTHPVADVVRCTHIDEYSDPPFKESGDVVLCRESPMVDVLPEGLIDIQAVIAEVALLGWIDTKSLLRLLVTQERSDVSVSSA